MRTIQLIHRTESIRNHPREVSRIFYSCLELFYFLDTIISGKGRLSPTSSRRLVDSGFGHYLNQNLSHRSNPQFQQEFFSDSEDFSGDKLLFDTRSSTESSSTSSNLLNKSSFGNRYNINGSNIENSNNNSFFRVKSNSIVQLI